MSERLERAVDWERSQQVLDAFGGFHDCFILDVRISFQAQSLTLWIDDLYSALDERPRREPVPGILCFTGIEKLVSHLAFVGGEVRLNGLELREKGALLEFELDVTMTEWIAGPDFAGVGMKVSCREFSVEQIAAE
ncbi:MAG TPA: hypothetical protein VFZ09_27890 [Archangium sp.]|uniref:hypothetical protein n=1 Tax=Archangium sp. TaxID=1872627 RepID=UPI002E334378|nr:hypothetical protein [Archangium sp.]HEX5750083.1 hypothetical protein [Archangium sp.]